MVHQCRAKVSTEGECESVLEECWKRRRTEATEFNESSSRSHAVCTILLHASKDGISFASTAHICDLAGLSLVNLPHALITLSTSPMPTSNISVPHALMTLSTSSHWTTDRLPGTRISPIWILILILDGTSTAQHVEDII